MLNDERLIRAALTGAGFGDMTDAGVAQVLAEIEACDQDMIAELAGLRAVAEAAVKDEREGQELDRYDAGLLGDFGGGNAEWWQDYIRAELDRAHDFYQSQINTPPAAPVPEQASAAVPEDKWKPLLEAVMREMPSREYRGNAPGHAHAVPGIWDSDNVPYLAGKPCAWCLAYSTARKLLAASQPEVRNV